ncbi:hypothetical protein MnTg02_00579 [bacterium MnTg02]|nr:hypothetical protein MnTg02_00579 [bacterium MnTg02]
MFDARPERDSRQEFHIAAAKPIHGEEHDPENKESPRNRQMLENVYAGPICRGINNKGAHQS